MFAVGVLLVVGFLAAAPALERVPGLGPGIEALRESDIESGAFWYRDVPKVRDAEFHMRGVRDSLTLEKD